jgi:peptide/nickel transport system substrate-binding protein
MVERLTRRQFLIYGGAAAGMVVAACTPGSSSGPSPTPRGSTGGTGATGATGAVDDLFHIDGLPDIESAEVVTDRSLYPTSFAERPEFADMVQAGTLPPVAERIGQDPLVLRPLDSIGTYGGTIRRAYTGVGDYKNASFFNSGPDTLFYWDRTRTQLTPWIANGYELSDDGRELIVHLRRGMRWSDGEPFTADDILFWREDITLHPDLPGLGNSLNPGGQLVEVTKVDDFTVSYVSQDPYPLLPQLMATTGDLGGPAWIGEILDGGYMPKHYFEQFHPTYVGEAEAQRLAENADYPTWIAHLQYLNQWGLNPDLPTVSPWVTVRPLNDPPHTFGPNPYSVWVDTEGNQLPYIGDITFELVQQQDVITLKATEGEFDFQDIHLTAASLPVLIENQDRSGYTIHQTPGELLDHTLRVNLSFDKDPVIGELIRTTDFRRALSLGIDRDEINEAVYLGTATSTAPVPTDYNQYFPGPEWRTRWATHDPEQANQLLDGIGLTDRDDEGFRLRPDGSGRKIVMEYDSHLDSHIATGELIKRTWAEIGIDMIVRLNTSVTAGRDNELQFWGIGGGTDDPFIGPGGVIPVVSGWYGDSTGPLYTAWFVSNGEEGQEPPASLQGLNDEVELYREGLQTTDDEHRIELGKELFRIHADQVYTISTVGFGLGYYGMYLANNDLKNVPGRVLSTNHQFTPENTFPMQFYY